MIITSGFISFVISNYSMSFPALCGESSHASLDYPNKSGNDKFAITACETACRRNLEYKSFLGASSRRNRRLNPSGFTLIEIFIAIVLFATGTLAILQMLTMGLFSGGENANAIIAMALAQEKMEAARNTAYGSIVNEAKAQVVSYTFFQREVVVTAPQSNLKEVTVNVYWTDKSGEIKTSLVTYASNI